MDILKRLAESIDFIEIWTRICSMKIQRKSPAVQNFIFSACSTC
ncbi:hypothetical protein CHCC20335_1131 [Bacillus paralicheniformis]|nr:hypothetical protein CHCC20335_1131 [Bacillus paralicheniformis]